MSSVQGSPGDTLSTLPVRELLDKTSVSLQEPREAVLFERVTDVPEAAHVM